MHRGTFTPETDSVLTPRALDDTLLLTILLMTFLSHNMQYTHEV